LPGLHRQTPAAAARSIAAMRRHLTLVFLIALVAACGGGGGGDPPVPPQTAPQPPAGSGSIASAPSPMDPNCTGGSSAGTLYANAEVEPYVAVNPGNANHLIGAWQQDRWSGGAARAVMTGASFDGGRTWTRTLQPFSVCAAGTGLTGGYERATDPWVDIGPDGTVHAMGLAVSGGAFTTGALSAMLAARSTDGGRTWSPPAVLVRDGPAFFHDKNALTADPTDARYVYGVWDRLDPAGNGPTMLARSTDGGVSWEAARVIYAPAPTGGAAGVSQTIGNRIVVRPNGEVINLFAQIDTVSGQATRRLGVIRSIDKGATWGAPVFIAELRSVGTRDPQTGTAVRDGALIPAIAAGPDGALWVTWQDARFSNGARDAVTLSRSVDGGATWSAPVAINTVSGTAAFAPAIIVRPDGLVGVLHYDLRADTADPATLLASVWLLTSRDGAAWTETAVLGPFDMAQAPNARGLFLGDYFGLAAAGTTFLPLITSAAANPANRTDIVSLRIEPQTAAVAATRARALSARAPSAVEAARWRAAEQATTVNAMEQRVPGWAARVGLPR
jgi:BNR repeat-like domain